MQSLGYLQTTTGLTSRIVSLHRALQAPADIKKAEYTLERPEERDKELKTWQAYVAQALSEAVTYMNYE